MSLFSAPRRALFILLAPVTLPLYILFLAATNLLGGAFYIVIEASLVPLRKKPITLSRGQMAALAIPVLLTAPIAAAVHVVIFAIAALGRTISSFGRWQTSTTSPATAFLTGLLWTLVALWTTVTCFNAAVGVNLIGQPVRGVDLFVESAARFRALKDLPEASQRKRKELIADIAARPDQSDLLLNKIRQALEDDDVIFHRLPRPIMYVLTGMPWYFTPAAYSEDGVDHSALMLGPLLFVWLLLVRWPGTFKIFRSSMTRSAWFLIRTGIAACAVLFLVNWEPNSDFVHFAFDPSHLPTWFAIACPGYWMRLEFTEWSRPEWCIFNAGLWLALLGIASFIWWTAWWIAPMLGWPRYYVSFLASRLLQRKRIALFSVGAVTLCVAMMIIVISVMGGFADVIRQRAHGLLGDVVVDGGLQGFPYYQGFVDKLADLKDPKTGEKIVAQATPAIMSYGILQFPKTKKTASVKILGIRLNEYVRVNEFGKDLFYNNRFGGTTLAPQQQPVYAMNDKSVPVLPGDMDAQYQKYVDSLPPAERAEEIKKYHRTPGDLFPGPGFFKGPERAAGYEGKNYPGIIVGRSIIFRRLASGEFNRHDDYPRGEACMLTVLPITRTGDVSPEPPPKPALRYVDDSRTGIHEIDSVYTYVDFDFLQKLLSMDQVKKTDGGMAGARCSQILIKLMPELSASREKTIRAKQLITVLWDEYRDTAPADQLEERLLRQVDASTWEEMQAGYIAAIEKEKFLVLIMFGVISVVAVFLILCIFYMIVQEKTRDIGIIKSIGGSAEGVAAVFLAYGGAIGIVGCVLGALLGVTFVEHINDVQDALARLNPNWRVWSPETYSFDKIPDMWKWSEVIGISVLAIISSIIGAALPAIRAGRTWPVESLRYE